MDFSVVEATRDMKARGLPVTFYPSLMIDISAGNTLPDPYSDNVAIIGQPVLPWYGRIAVKIYARSMTGSGGGGDCAAGRSVTAGAG